jgi:hypothetical protein
VRITVGEIVMDLTEAQISDLRRQLSAPVSSSLIDAAAAADALGVSREYVYDHAEELGGVKIGGGPKGRWRFDQAKLGFPEVKSSPSTGEGLPPSRSRRRRQPGADGLLQVRGGTPDA